MAVSVSKRRPRTSKKTEDKPGKHKDHGRTLIVCPFSGDFCSIFCRIFYRVPLLILLLFVVYLWSSSTTVISGNVVRFCVSSRKLNNLYCLSAGSQPGFHLPVTGDNLKPAIEVKNEDNDVVLGKDRDPAPGFKKKDAKAVGETAEERVPDDSGVGKSVNNVVETDKFNNSHDRDRETGHAQIKENLDSSLGQDRKNRYDSGDHGPKKENLDFSSETGEEEPYRYIKFKNDGDARAVKAVEEYLQVQRSWRSSNRNGENSKSCDRKGIYVYDLPSKFNKDLLGLCEDMVPWASNSCRFFKNDAFGEPIESLGKGWYKTHQYSLEPIFHSRVLKHQCRVYNESQANLFYVPFYGGLDVLRWHFKNVSEDLKDSLGIEVIKWLGTKKSWRRNSGRDHVFVLGKISWDFRRRRDSIYWGSRLLELQEMQNPTKLLIERDPWHVNDVAVPHPTYFHPKLDSDIVNLQIKIISKPRRSLVSFAGAARTGQRESIRSTIIDQCKSSPPEKCRFMDCASGGCDEPETIINLFQDSEFCLQPPGDSPTRKSVFDSLISGCIPVIFDPYTAYYQYTWHLPEDHRRYSVYISQEEVREGKVNVVEKLMGKTLREREDLRSYIVYELLPGLVYGDSDNKFERFQDAFDIAVNNLLEKMSKLEST